MMKDKISVALFAALVLFTSLFIVYDQGKKVKEEVQYFNYMPDTTGIRVIHLDADPFDVDVKVVIGSDALAASKVLRYWTGDMNIQAATLNVRGMTIWPDRNIPGIPCIWIPSIPKTPDEQGVLAHEMTHIVQMLMSYVGVTLTEASEEAYAYMVGYLTRQFYEGCLELK